MAFDEIVGFIAKMDPAKLVQFSPSEKLQNRVNELLGKNQDGLLSDDERKELEYYLVLDNIISLAKVRAQKLLNAA